MHLKLETSASGNRHFVAFLPNKPEADDNVLRRL